MSCQDVVKLCYQREFGCGHMIRDEESSLQFLLREMEAVKPGTPGFLFEDIGNGMSRFYLGMAKIQQIPAETVNSVFVQSAQYIPGSMEAFRNDFHELLEMADEGLFPFQRSQLEEYLAAYQAAGCPMVSHSETYRNNYHPAYRVILRRLWNAE